MRFSKVRNYVVTTPAPSLKRGFLRDSEGAMAVTRVGMIVGMIHKLRSFPGCSCLISRLQILRSLAHAQRRFIRRHHWPPLQIVPKNERRKKKKKKKTITLQICNASSQSREKRFQQNGGQKYKAMYDKHDL
jgi:hypothetical protein